MVALRNLPDLAASVSAALTDAGIEHVVSGAVAMAAHGYVRATADLDLLVVAPSVRLPEIFAIGRSHGFAGEDRDLIASIRDRSVATLKSGAVRLEFLVPVLPYHHTLVSRAVPVEMAATTVPVVSLPDLVLLKLLWRRPKDVPDIHALLRLAGPSFDSAYAQDTLASILPDDDPRHAELAVWIEQFAK